MDLVLIVLFLLECAGAIALGALSLIALFYVYIHAEDIESRIRAWAAKRGIQP